MSDFAALLLASVTAHGEVLALKYQAMTAEEVLAMHRAERGAALDRLHLLLPPKGE